MRLLDRGFIVLVVLGALGHTMGSLATYPVGGETLVYALGVSVLGLTCGYLNFLRSQRKRDVALAFAACFTALGQAGVAVAWGFAIGHPFDPRVIGFSVSAGGLAVFSAFAMVERA